MGSIPGLAQWIKGSGGELWCRSQIWLGSGIVVVWCRPVAVAPVQPLAWTLPYVSDAVLKSK